jgi:hypothetical protein
MVTYAQQTDPNKANKSSIDTTKRLDTPVTPTNTAATAPSAETLKTEAVATQPTTPTQPAQTASPVEPVKTGSYYKDVYLPKVQAERERRTALGDVKNIETPAPSKAETMDVKTVATQYDAGAISATDLENLKTTNPLKYQEAKAEIERKRTLDAINQNQQDFLTTYKSM